MCSSKLVEKTSFANTTKAEILMPRSICFACVLEDAPGLEHNHQVEGLSLYFLINCLVSSERDILNCTHLLTCSVDVVLTN